jgi:uncharacterized protein
MLGHYVYAYIDPRNGEVFYIGKGVGARATAHLNDRRESQKFDRIASIRAGELEPRIDIIAHGLRDDQEAARVEAALIELVGVRRLTNAIRGLRTSNFPRKPLLDFVVECAPREIEIDVPCLLFRINQQFFYGMSGQELYESTRGIWVIGKRRREHAQYAMPVYAGIIREVYKIDSWHRAGSTPYKTRDMSVLAQQPQSRWEFVGHPASPDVRKKYIGCTVAHLFPRGHQRPVVGVGC